MATCGETNPAKGCGAEVIFVLSAKSGKRQILDAKPKKGIILTEVGMGDLFAMAAPDLPSTRARVVDVYTDHHATCPKAAEWR